MKSYSPFNKAIHDLQPSHLGVLKSVSEGWYVEYKRESVSARALAKAVSAFANTYGGWLFLGVQEGSKSDAVAHSFPGIANEDVDATLQRLRHAAAEHLSPAPHFETKVLRGPCEEIGLAQTTSVVAIGIPQSHTAPHVHKDGRIYRRVADGSEPKPETDRFILDQLWRRAEPIREMTRKWVARDPEFTEAEEKWPFVRLLLCVDPWCQRDPWLTALLPQIRAILTDTRIRPQAVPFDTIYTTAGGFIARQVQGNNPQRYGLTWKFRRDLSCELVVPLPLYGPDNVHDLASDLDGYAHSSRFIDTLTEQGFRLPKIADLNFLMTLLIGVVAKYRRLLKLADAEGEFYFKARALNVWRVLPFIDIGAILDEYHEHGLPLIMDSVVTFPTGDEPDSFQPIPERIKQIDDHSEAPTEEDVCQIQAHLMFTWISQAFGVPILLEGQTRADTTIIPTDELVEAGVRAMAVQRNRNNQRSEY